MTVRDALTRLVNGERNRVSFNPTWGRRQGPGRPVLAPRRRGALLPTLLVLGVLVVLVVIATRVWVDLLWFQSVGFARVFTTTLWVRTVLFVVGAVLTGGAIALSLSLGYRTRPVYAPVSPEQASLDRYREQVEPLRRLATVVIPIAVGLIAGATASQSWRVYLLWRNRTPFGVDDPQFGIDLGFFVFTLPFLRFVLSLLVAAVVLSAIAAFVTHYLYGDYGCRATVTARRPPRGCTCRCWSGSSWCCAAGATGSTGTRSRPRATGWPTTSPA